MRILAITFLLALLPLAAREKLRVLMIGNSYVAQTRHAVEGFLKADPVLEIEFAVHAPGGSFLDQHAGNPKVAGLLAQPWDVVVLQEQSQLPAFAMGGDARAMKRFKAGGPELIRMIRKALPEAKILLFETWARHPDTSKDGTLGHFGDDPERMQEALTKAYRLLAREAGAGVGIVEVGQAFGRWYAAKGRGDGVPSLHKADGSHPSGAGAFITGAVFYRALTGRNPALVAYRPAGWKREDLATELLRIGVPSR